MGPPHEAAPGVRSQGREGWFYVVAGHALLQLGGHVTGHDDAVVAPPFGAGISTVCGHG